MANVKFSQFTSEANVANFDGLVGYQSSTNKRINSTDLVNSIQSIIDINQLSGTLSIANGGTGVTTGRQLTASSNRLQISINSNSIFGATDVSFDANEGNFDLANIGGSLGLTSQVTGILPEANGGTGQSALSSVDISSFGNAAKPFDIITPVGGVFTWNFNNGYNQIAVPVSGANSLAITNVTSGCYGTLLINDTGASGFSSFGLPTTSKVANAGAGVITPTAGGITTLSFVYYDATFYWTYGLNYT